MPRPLLGDGPERAHRVMVLRSIGVVLAVALGVVGVWLIVTSDTQKGMSIGILAGLWGLLIGAYSAFTTRNQAPQQTAVATMPTFDPDVVPPGGGVIDVRPRNEVQRRAEAQARREFQARLEKALRQELQEGLAREVAGLRAEIAALRGELLEKVGGQLRLERIETTRVIGSDLEALQAQVRELRVLQSGDEDVTVTETVIDVVEDEPAYAEPIVVGPVAHPVVEPVVEPVAVVEPEPARERERVPAAVADPEPAEVVEVVEAVEAVEAVEEPEPARERERVPAAVADAEPADAPEQFPPAAAEPAAVVEPAAEPSAAAEPDAEPARERERVPAAVAGPEPETPAAVVEPVAEPARERERTPTAVSEPAAEPAPAEPVATRSYAEPPARPPRIGGFDGDPFASMPRLSPFTDFEPVGEPAQPVAEDDEPSRHGTATPRRARRYREDDEDDNVLARILQRERTNS